MATETTTQDPAAPEPTPVKPSAKKPRSKKQVVKKPAAKKSAAKKKVARKPVSTKKFASKKKSAKKRASNKRVAAAKSVVKKSAPKKRKAKTLPASNKINKAQAIRDVAKELGKKARPKHIIAALAEKGITVVSAQVSTVLKAAGLRRGRRRKKVQGMVAAARPSANGHGFNIDDLVKVKKLANELGGAAKLKELAAALERLI